MTVSKPYSQKRWSLKDMYPADKSPEMKADFKKIEELTAEFEKFRPLLKEDVGEKDFLRVIKVLEEIHRVGARLGSYAGLWFSEDTQDQAALSLMAKTEQLSADLGNRTLFFGLWWKDTARRCSSAPDEKLPVITATGWRKCDTSNRTPSPRLKRRSSIPRMSPASTRSPRFMTQSPTNMCSRSKSMAKRRSSPAEN